MTVGMDEWIDEEGYWRLLGRVRGNKKGSKNDRRGRGNRIRTVRKGTMERRIQLC